MKLQTYYGLIVVIGIAVSFRNEKYRSLLKTAYDVYESYYFLFDAHDVSHSFKKRASQSPKCNFFIYNDMQSKQNRSSFCTVITAGRFLQIRQTP